MRKDTTEEIPKQAQEEFLKFYQKAFSSKSCRNYRQTQWKNSWKKTLNTFLKGFLKNAEAAWKTKIPKAIYEVTPERIPEETPA